MKHFAKFFLAIFFFRSIAGARLSTDNKKNYVEKAKIAATGALTGIYTVLALHLSLNSLKNLYKCLDNETKKIVDGNIITVQQSTMSQIKRFIMGSLVEASTAAGIFNIAKNFAELTEKQLDKLNNVNLKPANQFTFYKPTDFSAKYNIQDSNPLIDGLTNCWMSLSMLIYLARQCNLLKHYVSNNTNSRKDKISLLLFPFLASACMYGIQKNTKSAYENFKIFLKDLKNRTISTHRRKMITNIVKIKNII